MTPRTTIAGVLAALVFAAPANATVRPGDGLRKIEQIIPSKCTGHTKIHQDPTLPRPVLAHPGTRVWGEATGMRYDEPIQRWVTDHCVFSLAKHGRTPEQRCADEIHEYLHLALEQADHTGLLDPRFLVPRSRELCRSHARPWKRVKSARVRLRVAAGHAAPAHTPATYWPVASTLPLTPGQSR